MKCPECSRTMTPIDPDADEAEMAYICECGNIEIPDISVALDMEARAEIDITRG